MKKNQSDGLTETNQSINQTNKCVGGSQTNWTQQPTQRSWYCRWTHRWTVEYDFKSVFFLKKCKSSLQKPRACLQSTFMPSAYHSGRVNPATDRPSVSRAGGSRSSRARFIAPPINLSCSTTLPLVLVVPLVGLSTRGASRRSSLALLPVLLDKTHETRIKTRFLFCPQWGHANAMRKRVPKLTRD